MTKTEGASPSFKVYKAVLSGADATVGHVQLMDIDRQSATCVLGRVLIFREHRGRGLAVPLVRSAVGEAFAGLGLKEVTLLVFAFNRPAVATYERVGFVRSSAGPLSHDINGSTWEVLVMELSRERWSEISAAE